MPLPPKTSRRQLLKHGLSLGTIAVAMNFESMAESAEPNDFVDAHSHIWTRDVSQFPLKAGVAVDDLDPPSFTARELLAIANPLGVRRVVLIAHTGYYEFDNRYLIHAAEQFPGTFKVVGMIDDRRPRPGELMKALQSQHVTGFRITPALRGTATWLDNPGMREMWRSAAVTRQAMCCLINPENLSQVEAMCRKFPETPVVIDHFGRIGIDGTIREKDLKQLCDLARRKQTYVKISAFYALGRKTPPYEDLIPMIRRVYEAFGARRIMWASDAPYQIVGEHRYAASLSLVRDQLDFLSAEERLWLLRQTAEAVFFPS